MDRHRALLSVVPLILWSLATGIGCAADPRAPSLARGAVDAPLVYSVRGPFEDRDPVLVTGNPNPLCVPRYVTLLQRGGARGDRYMIEFVFDYASEEWDRDRLAVTISVYDTNENVLVTETQQTEDLRSRTPTGPVMYLPAAMYQSSSNQVQITANGCIQDVAQIVITVAAN